MQDASEPLVSVSMITYNHNPYIIRAIEGVLCQETSFPIELLIGEDCSTDGTREIVFDYAQRFPDRIRLLTAESNVGAKANIRRVYAAARGKYMAWCEGDDYWHDPGKLQMQVDFLESHPEYVMVHTDCDWFTVATDNRIASAIGEQEDLQGHALAVAVLAHDYWITTPTVCARRDLVMRVREENPFEFSGAFMMGDKQQWLELSRIGKIHYIPRSTATMNRLPESVTESRDPAKRIRYSYSSLKLREHYIAKFGINGPKRTQIIREVCLPMLPWACAIGDGETAADVAAKLQEYGYRLRTLDALYVAGAQSAAKRKLAAPLIAACLKAGEMRRRVAGG